MKTQSKPGGGKKQKAAAAKPEAVNTEPVVVAGAVGRDSTGLKSVERMIRWRSQDVVAMAVVVLVLVVSSTWVYNNNRQQTVCSDQLLGVASKAIDGLEWDNLGKYQTEIVAKGAYNKDPNCLYVLMRIAMLNNDAGSANKYLQALQKTAKNGAEPHYSKALTARIFTLDQSERIISSLQKSQKLSAQQDAAQQGQLLQMDRQADKIIQQQGQKQ